MSKYSRQPLDLSGLKTVPIAARGGKVTTDLFAKPYQPSAGVSSLIASFPRILAAESFHAVLDALRTAKSKNKPILWGMGGHVIKCGLAPIFIDLIHRGYVTGFIMNGAATIHDFEIAIAGHTSEDVEAVLPDGRFGSAEETGRHMNEAIAEGHRDGLGIGEALGRRLDCIADPRFADSSLVLAAWRANIPLTVHVALGTDTPHTHPAADPAAIGACTHHDFRLLCTLVGEMHDGGVYLNIGSAVVLPEVFLKAISVARNLGNPVLNFTTVNMDFLQHYRPKANVVDRPHAKAGGRGYTLTGHHEIMVPLLAAALIDGEARQ
jgi:hypothetical protein